MMDLNAKELFAAIRKYGGAYSDWTEEHKKGFSNYMSENNFSKMLFQSLDDALGTNSNKSEKEKEDFYNNMQDDSFDGFKHYYGFETNLDKDPISAMMKMIIPLAYSKSELKEISKITFGVFPKISSIDVDTGELETQRIANGLAIKAANNTYLVGLTTQFTKIVNDFSVISCATSSNFKFNISPLKILDSYRALIQTRWINGEVPPTWTMHYMPEDIAKDNEWFLRILICNHLINTFFIFHEVEHILCNHLDLETNQNYQIDALNIELARKRRENEFEADAKAAKRICKVLEKLISLRGIDNKTSESLITYNLFRLSTFFDFLTILEEFNNCHANSHPPAIERKRKIDEIIFNSGLPLNKKYHQKASLAFQRLMGMISKKLVK